MKRHLTAAAAFVVVGLLVRWFPARQLVAWIDKPRVVHVTNVVTVSRVVTQEVLVYPISSKWLPEAAPIVTPTTEQLKHIADNWPESTRPGTTVRIMGDGNGFILWSNSDSSTNPLHWALNP